jgi:hypothetical protein
MMVTRRFVERRLDFARFGCGLPFVGGKPSSSAMVISLMGLPHAKARAPRLNPPAATITPSPAPSWIIAPYNSRTTPGTMPLRWALHWMAMRLSPSHTSMSMPPSPE